jgi:hypothetical protein
MIKTRLCLMKPYPCIKRASLVLLLLILAGCKPIVTITSPSNGAMCWLGQEITFAGSATDLQDGQLSGDSLIWTSSIDGEIGRGTEFTRSLSEGTHTITLTATNSLDEKETDAITITVQLSHAVLYEAMWGTEKNKYLPLLRAFRDAVLLNREISKNHVLMLYNNSIEVLEIFAENPSLFDETEAVIDELMPEIQLLLDESEVVLSKEQLGDFVSLLTKVESEASPKFRAAIGAVKKDINQEEIFEQLGITISK